MIGKIIGGIVGAKLAKSEPGGLKGPGGALVGMAVPMLLRRLSLPGMLALAVGGYAYKRYTEKNAKPSKRARRASPRKRAAAKPATA